MKKRNIIIISAIVLALVVATLITYSQGRQTSTFEQDFHIEDTSTVSKIFIADKNNHQVLLTRNAGAVADSAWTVDSKYLASTPMVDLLLETLNDMRIRQIVNKKAVPNVIKNLAASNIKVEVYQEKPLINWFHGKFRLFTREKLTKTYYVGHETQDMLGSYMLKEGDKEPYIIHIPGFRGFLTPRFVADPLAWRSHRIVDLDVNEIKSITLEIPDMPTESFAIHNIGNDFQMELTHTNQTLNGFDTAKVATFLSSFTNLNFDEYAQAVPEAELDTTFARTPKTILRITDTLNRTREVKTYLKYRNPEDVTNMPDTAMYHVFDLDRLYAVVDDSDTVLIQYYVFDNILQPASYFMGNTKQMIAK